MTIPSFVYSKPLTNRRHLVQITATMNVFIIFISILTFSLKTINELRVPVFNNVTSFGDNGTQLNVVQNTTIVSPVFFYSDAICNAWFTITLAIRLVHHHPGYPLHIQHRSVSLSVSSLSSLCSFFTRDSCTGRYC